MSYSACHCAHGQGGVGRVRRLHPRVDRVAHREVLGAAHQVAAVLLDAAVAVRRPRSCGGGRGVLRGHLAPSGRGGGRCPGPAALRLADRSEEGGDRARRVHSLTKVARALGTAAPPRSEPRRQPRRHDDLAHACARRRRARARRAPRRARTCARSRARATRRRRARRVRAAPRASPSRRAGGCGRREPIDSSAARRILPIGPEHPAALTRHQHDPAAVAHEALQGAQRRGAGDVDDDVERCRPRVPAHRAAPGDSRTCATAPEPLDERTRCARRTAPTPRRLGARRAARRTCRRRPRRRSTSTR